MKTLLVSNVLIALLFGSMASAQQRQQEQLSELRDTEFTEIDLPLLNTGDSTFGWRGLEMNDHGQVTGLSLEEGYPIVVLWDNGRLIRLPDMGTELISPRAINNRGEIVGNFGGEGGHWESNHGFFWKDGTMTDLGVMDVLDLNDRSDILYAALDIFGEDSAYFLLHHGAPIPVQVLSGPAIFYLNRMNNRGQIAGSCRVPGEPLPVGVRAGACIWEDGVTRHLHPAGGERTFSEVLAINDRGETAGVARDQGTAWWTTPIAVTWDKRGGIRNTGAAVGSTAWGMNNHGQVVGYGPQGGFIWFRSELEKTPHNLEVTRINVRGDMLGCCGVSTNRPVLLVRRTADMNGDGEVDCADLEIVRHALGKRFGQVGYDVRADLTGRGEVTWEDLVFVARRIHGRRCR